MALYSRLEPFERDVSAWSIYEGQISVFFLANDTPEVKQQGISLASRGTRVFSLLLNLLKPAMVRDKNQPCTFHTNRAVPLQQPEPPGRRDPRAVRLYATRASEYL